MTEPLAPKVLKVLKFDSPSGAEGCGIALTGDEYKDRVTGFPAPQVILSLRRRISVHAPFESIGDKYRSVGGTPLLDDLFISLLTILLISHSTLPLVLLM